MLYVNPQASFKSMDLAPGAKGRETEALKQFEQLFLFEMLKEMRKTVPDYGFFESGGQKAYFEEMMDDFTAGEMASSGQLGVASQMAQQLNAKVARAGDGPAGAAGALKSKGIPLLREHNGIQMVPPVDQGVPMPAIKDGFELKAVHPAGISLSRARESYQDNQ